ncbi:unnamed protein product, partial [Amoebophrya sp. A25]
PAAASSVGAANKTPTPASGAANKPPAAASSVGAANKTPTVAPGADAADQPSAKAINRPPAASPSKPTPEEILADLRKEKMPRQSMGLSQPASASASSGPVKETSTKQPLASTKQDLAGDGTAAAKEPVADPSKKSPKGDGAPSGAATRSAADVKSPASSSNATAGAARGASASRPGLSEVKSGEVSAKTG